ncbi:MAG: hypothetical protein ACRC6V_17830 [Bacteroidales bacterium]
MSENIPSGNSRGKQKLSLYKPGFIDDTNDLALKQSLEREYNEISNALVKVMEIKEELEARISKLENP